MATRYWLMCCLIQVCCVGILSNPECECVWQHCNLDSQSPPCLNLSPTAGWRWSIHLMRTSLLSRSTCHLPINQFPTATATLFWDLTIIQVGQHHSYLSQHQWATISTHEPPLNPSADTQPNVILADVETTTFTNTSAWHPKALTMFQKPRDQIAAKLQPSRALLHCVLPSRPVC